MALADLPNEVLLEIASNITSEKDLASFAKINRYFYELLITTLYRRDAKYSNGFAMCRAVETQNLSALEKALQAWRHVKKSAELPQFPLPDGTLLEQALEDRNLAEMQLLLAYGANPDSILAPFEVHIDYTALDLAIIRGDVAAVEELLAHEDTDVNICGSHGSPPILIASLFGYFEIVKMLLAHGAYAGSLPDVDDTPLHNAVKYNQPDLVRLLVNRDDVNPNAIYPDVTPLEIAVMNNMEDIVEILLTDERVEPDLTTASYGRTPLLRAALKQNDTMVQMLLDAGACDVIEDNFGICPAMLLEAPSAEARTKIIQEAMFPKRSRWVKKDN